MSDLRRPSLLYAVPGSDFMPSAGPTRNVLNQARAMNEWADVTLAFRRVLDPPSAGDPPVVEIAPARTATGGATDDSATRGMSYGRFLAYLRAIRAFLAERLPEVDVVLEKDWMLTGWVARQSRRAEVPCIPVKNWMAGAAPGRSGGVIAAVRHRLGAAMEGRLLRQAPCIVVETEILKESVVRRWRIDPARVEVIGLGVDRDRFRPSDPEVARSTLGLAAGPTILFYAGILDRTHDLEPLLRALVRLGNGLVRLHVAGDGPLWGRFQRYVRQAGGTITFHGRVPHEEVPLYIAAADLCLAPYDTSGFPRGEVAYSTLKVREYLSAGRAVATTSSGTLRSLVRHGESGFLLDNTEDAWYDLLRHLPARARLQEMGSVAAETELDSWADVSRAFERLTDRMMARSGGGSATAADVQRLAARKA